MDIRSLAINAARSEHLRNVRRRSRPAKGKRSWTPAEQEKVKLLFPDKRSLEKALPHRTWVAIRAQAGLLGLQKSRIDGWPLILANSGACGPQEQRSTNYVKRCRGTAGIKSSGKLAAENS
jgi:hypothetical protein